MLFLQFEPGEVSYMHHFKGRLRHLFTARISRLTNQMRQFNLPGYAIDASPLETDKNKDKRIESIMATMMGRYTNSGSIHESGKCNLRLSSDT